MSMRLRLYGGADTMATLNASRISHAFVALLPLTLTLSDLAASKKIADLPSRLTTEDGPSDSRPSADALAYYVP